MTMDQLIALVRERGEYGSAAEAELACRTVLDILGTRLPSAEAKDLASQLPGSLGDAVRDSGPAQGFGSGEFLHRVADALGATDDTAQWDASAVLSAVGDAVTGGQLNQLLTVLPAGYAPLFGHAELS